MITLRMEERIKMVKAMEYICRQINDEDVLMGWLMNGVADGDIKYGDLNMPEDGTLTDGDIGIAYDYCKDDTFAELMGCFLRRMKFAEKSGGLYCGGVVSK